MAKQITTYIFFLLFYLALGCSKSSFADERSVNKNKNQETTEQAGNSKSDSHIDQKEEIATSGDKKNTQIVEDSGYINLVPWRILDKTQIKEHLKNQLSKAATLVTDFKPGVLLEESIETLDSQKSKIYRLRKLTEKDMVKLRRLLKPEESFIGIQTAQYWEKIYELQKKGVSIAYFANENLPRSPAGLYINSQKLIVMRPLDSFVTLEHEGRHYEQYLQITNRKISLKSDLSNILPDECKQKLSHAFGEIDATLYENRDLKRLIKMLPASDQIPFYIPDKNHRNLSNLALDDFFFAFNYIIDSGKNLESAVKSCPQAIRPSIEKLSKFIDSNKYMAVNVVALVAIKLDSVARNGHQSEIINDIKSEYEQSIKDFSLKVGFFLNQLKSLINIELNSLSPNYSDALAADILGLSFYKD